jgi:spermidine synthase
MTDRTAPPAARLPVPATVGRGIVLACVFVCAACGLVYELELVATAASLTGGTVTQTSVVLSVMVFAMGIGSLLAKRLRCRAAAGFCVIEVLLALVGGGSAMALYAVFAWFDRAGTALVAFSVLIGVLIGAEMPLLMTLIQRIRAQDAGNAVADLFAADYVGALVGGLTFPFLLLPLFGQLTGALLTGVVNAVAGAVVVLWLFRGELSRRGRWTLLAATACAVASLLLATAFAAPFERAARQAVYGGEVRVAVRSGAQEIVLTGRPGAPGGQRGGGGQTLELWTDGRLRASSADEAERSEALVHPAMAAGRHARALFLTEGVGLALREAAQYPSLRSATVVARDPEVLRLARTDPGLTRLNAGALRDPRARLTVADPLDWLRGHPGRTGGYDVVIVALPPPGAADAARLSSQEFFGLAARALAPGGRLAVLAGAEGAPPRHLGTVDATLRAAGLRTTPYAGDGRLPGRAGDWGVVLAARGAPPPVRLARHENRPALDALTPGGLREAVRRAGRDRVAGLPPSTLMRPRLS